MKATSLSSQRSIPDYTPARECMPPRVNFSFPFNRATVVCDDSLSPGNKGGAENSQRATITFREIIQFGEKSIRRIDRAVTTADANEVMTLHKLDLRMPGARYSVGRAVDQVYAPYVCPADNSGSR